MKCGIFVPLCGMHCFYQLFYQDAREVPLASASVDCVVTSPPYPVIAMWDDAFAAMNPRIAQCLAGDDAKGAYDLMHRELDKVWMECWRVVKPGGFVCINIGDAVRSFAGVFRRYANAARISTALEMAGFDLLPLVLWRKPTNAPNKFMGSGMLPAGAYVTLEHEYILIARKPAKPAGENVAQAQQESAAEAAALPKPGGDVRSLRRRSALFWEERNQWFSDVWEIRGARQVGLEGKQGHTPSGRTRTGSFPLELPLRLIAMYSVQGGLVLDPFCGTGTTLRAALALGRSAVGLDIDRGCCDTSLAQLQASLPEARELARARLLRHAQWVLEERAKGKEVKYHCAAHDLAVKTAQETDLCLLEPVAFLDRDSAGQDWPAALKMTAGLYPPLLAEFRDLGPAEMLDRTPAAL